MRSRPEQATSSADADFDDVVSGLLPRIRRRALQLTGCPHTADDAVQDVCLRLLSHRQRLVRHPEPYAYAHATLTSVLCDAWRRHRRTTPVATTPEQTSHDCAPGVEARLEVERLLGILTSSQAVAVRLIDMYGYTHDEAARLLGVHRGTVARTRRRALDRLRTALPAARPPPEIRRPRHTSAALRACTPRKAFIHLSEGHSMRSSNALRLARRAAVVCLATAGVAAFGGPAAQAAPASAGATSGTAAAAAVIRTYGLACAGTQVRRCAWFNVDHTNNRVRAYSGIADVNGGRNYTVATHYVRLQAWNGRTWVNLGYNADADGWHATSDVAPGKLVGCRNGGVYILRSVAHFQWRGNPSGSQWGASKAVRVRC